MPLAVRALDADVRGRHGAAPPRSTFASAKTPAQVTSAPTGSLGRRSARSSPTTSGSPSPSTRSARCSGGSRPTTRGSCWPSSSTRAWCGGWRTGRATTSARARRGSRARAPRIGREAKADEETSLEALSNTPLRPVVRRPPRPAASQALAGQRVLGGRLARPHPDTGAMPALVFHPTPNEGDLHGHDPPAHRRLRRPAHGVPRGSSSRARLRCCCSIPSPSSSRAPWWGQVSSCSSTGGRNAAARVRQLPIEASGCASSKAHPRRSTAPRDDE